MKTDYKMLAAQLEALLDAEDDALAISANFVALLYSQISDINWLGLYVVRNQELVLGPFQGKPACVRIPHGKGVCGTAFEKACTLRVDDVHKFDGHIVCDAVSRSEVVVPLIHCDQVFAVLDVDSPTPGRFDADDEQGLEELCAQFVRQLALARRSLLEFI